MKASFGFLLMCILTCGHAQERTLYWDALSVDARLDAQGVLHMIERHTMVFGGEWNGGERVFRLGRGQELSFFGLSEIDPETKLQTPWSAGDLDHVGEYALNGKVLRWRSRMPEDPPFDQAVRIYELHYALTGVVIEEQGVYRIDHDLAFPDRSGEIRVFDATLELDPVWQADGLERTWHVEDLQPGESVLATATLTYSGASRPMGIANVPPPVTNDLAMELRYALFALLVAFVLIHAIALMRRERARGRFEPTPSLDLIDERWLEANVFNRPAEVVGAAWDLDTSASEVAALLARLAQSGVIKSNVQSSGGWFKHDTLHMELLGDRDQLAPHERALIDALFIGGSRTTDTEKIRKHYAKTGFTPAALIQKSLEQQAPIVFGSKVTVPAWARWLTASLFVGGVIAFIASTVRAPEVVHVVLIALAAILGLSIVSIVFAYLYRTNVHDLSGRLMRVFVTVGLVCAVAGFMLVGKLFPLTPAGAVCIAFVALAFANMIFNTMRTRETQDSLAVRRQLGLARKYFERELRSEQPRLKDEWFPYLLAFGLGPHIDKWFNAFGGQDDSMRSATRSSGAAHIGSAIGSRSSSSTWTGGGGTFGGAGASGTWASAVGGIAAGVAQPSSSSSSGSSGGGGGSSGGGGGGGW